MRRWRMFLLFAALSACQMPEGGPPGGMPGAEEKEAVDDRVLVETADAGPGDVSDHLVTTGLLESERQADLVPEANGVVTQLLAEEGDVVKKGQLLAVLANPTLEGAAQRANLELDRIRQDAARAERLHSQGALSDAEHAAALQALELAETSYREATRTRGFTRIEAPFDGVVALRDLRLGEVAGGRRAFQVVDLNALRVVVQLPERDLARVQLGQPVTLEGAYDASATSTGQVLRVSPVVDPATGTARVTIAVDPGQTALRPGQFSRVRIQVDRRDGVLTIPRQALVWEDGEPVAFRVEDAPPEEDEAKEGEEGEKKEESPGLAEQIAAFFQGEDEDKKEEEEKPTFPRRVAKKVRLEIGYSDQARVEVRGGLEAGQPVITVGTDGLRDGTAVRLPSDPPPEKKKDPKDKEGKGS